MSIQVFSPYFDWVIRFLFLLLNCRTFLCILEMTPYQIYGLQIFSVIPEVAFKFGWLFSLLYWSFPVWGSSIYLFFDFVACTFGVIPTKSLPRQMSWRFSPVFSFRGFTVLGCSFLFHLKRPYNTFCKNSVLMNSLYFSLFEELFISLFILSDNLVE